MNKATLKSRATLIGKVFAEKGVPLTRAEQLDLVAKLEGARGWNHASSEMKEGDAPVRNAPLDALQLEAVKAYCSGDFSHVTDTDGVRAQGDMLFHFAMDEIGDIKGDREQAVQLLRQAASELEDLADALEEGDAKMPAPVPDSDVPYVDKPTATDSKGNPLAWNIRWITNRLGEVDIIDAHGHQDLADWVKQHPAEFDKLWGLCVEESAFVAELNGVRGVLYEVEVETTESEGVDSEGKPRCTVSEEERRLQLQCKVAELEAEHPKLTWAVIGPKGMWDGRLGAWGFFPETKLITKDEAHAVVDSIIQKFYR